MRLFTLKSCDLSKKTKMTYLYELYPIDNDVTSSVHTLDEGQNNLQISEKIFVSINAHSGAITINDDKKIHNDIIKIQHESGVFERVVSIVRRGELNLIESTRLDAKHWEKQVQRVWPSLMELPRIVFSHKQNEIHLLKIRWNRNYCARVGYMLEIKLLSGDASSLLWCPFPEMDVIPNMNEMSSVCMGRPFHTVKPVESNAIFESGRAEVKRAETKRALALRTACFEHEYPFSGTTHPKEEKTPASLMNLCNLVEDLFSHGRGKGPNMILVNYYPTGHHKISRHQDNDKAMGVLRDVYAFVDGYAREMEFAKVWNQKRKDELSISNDRDEDDYECVLKVKIPAGFYCMYGKRFQQLFTHEIKETYDKEFKTLCTSLTKIPAFADMPSKDIYNRVKIPQAEYVMEHADAVRKVLKGTNQRSILDMFGTSGLAVQRKTNESSECGTKRRRTEFSWFDEWIQPRISYTLRRFE